MSKSLSIRIPDELRDRLDVLAKTERRSVSNLVTLLLESALEARGDEPLGPPQNLSENDLRNVIKQLPILLKIAERRGMSDLVAKLKRA